MICALRVDLCISEFCLPHLCLAKTPGAREPEKKGAACADGQEEDAVKSCLVSRFVASWQEVQILIRVM